MAALKRETERLLCEMARSLRSGRIDALPARNSRDHNACAFCDYRSVCGHEDDDPERAVIPMTHAESLQELDERQVQNDAVDA